MSLAQVAEGSLNDMQGIVTRMRELAIESSNGTLGSTERGYVQTEFSALQKEVDRISNVTEFNGTHLLDGTASAGLTFQVGIHASSDNQLSMSIGRTTTSTLGSTSLHIASASLSTVTNALKAIGSFDKAIQQLSQARSKIGAVQNRMSVTLSNLGVAYDNLSAANSSIRDVDVAQETSRLTQEQILSQAGAAVLAQANQLPSTAVSLLRG
jgi:flagellin